MIVVLTAGGPANELPDLSPYKDAVHIGVDRGVVTLMGQNIEPKQAVGDFDSVTEAELQDILLKFPALERSPAEKDESDTELALAQSMLYEPETIILTGVTGGRLDHFMAALHIVFDYQKRYPDKAFLILNNQNRIRFMEPGFHRIERDMRYPYISFYPFAESIDGFTIKGFKYPVENETIPFGSTRFISNELPGEGTVEFTAGQLMVIESSD